MNQPDFFSGGAARSKEIAAREENTHGSAIGERRIRVVRSGLWAAYGDALGWISELTDSKGLKRRTNGAELREPIAWKRKIGGRFGVMASLPRGCYSDDSQLRLATSRAIRSDGFDVEAFAKVELPVWLSYGLGGGKSTSAAAANLSKRNSAWWNNTFKGWSNSGGNGAAMRIQPHVWVASAPEDPSSYLPDVIRNTVCTHSHPTGLMGAVIHALCVARAMTSGCVPSPDRLQEAISDAQCLPAIFEDDSELRYWRVAFEREAGDFTKAWGTATEEAQKAAQLMAGCKHDVSGKERYQSIVNALDLRNPQRRGSGMLTALAATGLAWCEASPAEAMRIAANTIDTDTDTIATMAGALLGATANSDPPVDVLDAEVFRAEADRLTEIAAGNNPPSHPYPDLLHWSAPKMRADALVRSKDGGLVVYGLGSASRLNDQPNEARDGKFRWQWVKLEFGQTLFIKSRSHLPDVEENLLPAGRVAPAGRRVQQNTLTPTRKNQSKPDCPDAEQAQTSNKHQGTPKHKNERNIQDVVTYVAQHIDNDKKVMDALRRVVRKGTRGEVAAFTAALIDMLHRSDAETDGSSGARNQKRFPRS